MALIQADPAGRPSAVGTLSPSDCYPAGPAGPYFAGGPVGTDDCLRTLESYEELILDHADPAGQHAVVLDTTESPGGMVVENILDGRPMEGITWPELLEYSLRLLDATLDSGLVKNISDWEPEVSPVPDTTLDSQLMEGITNPEHSAAGVSLDSGPMEGMLCLEPSEQLVLNTSLVARPSEFVMEEWKPVINPVISNTLDSRLMEGNTYLERLAPGVYLDSGPTEGASCLEPLEQSVLRSSLAARPVEGVMEKISDWKPVINPVMSYTLDSQLMEGNTYLEHSALGGSLDSGPTEGASCLEPLEQSVLRSSLAARPVEGVMEKISDWKPVINPVMSYTLDSQLMEGNTYLEHSALGVSLDSGPTEGYTTCYLPHTVVEGGPAGPEVIEPLALLVRDNADPAGQHSVTQNTVVKAGPLAQKLWNHRSCWFLIVLTPLVRILMWKWAPLAQKLWNHWSCWSLIVLTLLVSMRLFGILRDGWSILLHGRSRPYLIYDLVNVSRRKYQIEGR